jgi:N6-adenosine-specific RNA methylase IME4
MLDAIEDLMHAAGLYGVEDILPVNQGRMFARWKLGKALEAIDRKAGRPSEKDIIKGLNNSFSNLLNKLGLTPPTAMEAQRIGTLPDDELKSVLNAASKEKRLLYFAELIKLARPYWYKASREAKHRKIATAAKQILIVDRPGPFPLIYADPPWKFNIYSEKGLERTPDQHYPTLTDDEIAGFVVGDALVSEIAHKDAVLFLWCTSSNQDRALDIMKFWGFTFKTSAVWDKMKSGLGLVFRNQHEVLLYGTRGSMPGPQFQPKSVFRYPRGKHSEKPKEVRAAIEKMYPDFKDECTRAELFARGKFKGWSTYGFEANKVAA